MIRYNFTRDRPTPPLKSDFATSEEAAAHDAWFRAKVERAMASTASKIPHGQMMAEMRANTDGRGKL
ncbi:stability determinant [Sphingomonas sp. MA1305]|uniref:type II toxin-antitoxin system RelB family antitoxin n=1 Tax=Sphingomonas sp. MA1305 TaxID=2479204 RepID=UPI0018DF4C03|nr:stability determinant [Sphingomonas sp. MA1305]MBI0475437.1 stability determinant [Sphingomonas sp. MA1305]